MTLDTKSGDISLKNLDGWEAKVGKVDSIKIVIVFQFSVCAKLCWARRGLRTILHFDVRSL